MKTARHLTLNQPCLGVVLTGGLSSRMGRDKALLTRQSSNLQSGNLQKKGLHLNHAPQENMLSYSKQQLKNAGVNEIIISGKNHGVADQFEQLGPMGGIYTVLKKFQPQALLILPVDLPLIDAESLQQLKRVGELSQKAVFFQNNMLPLYLPVNAFVEQFFEQTFLPFKQSFSDKKSAISNRTEDKPAIKGPSIKALLMQIPHKTLTPKNSQSLFNANTPEQWQQAKQKFNTTIVQNRKDHV
jgi:molybdenum cofactor guanylyltransferase